MSLLTPLILLPFLQRLFPVGGTIVYGFLFLHGLVARLVASAFFLHGRYGGIVEYLDGSTTYCVVELFLTKGFSLYVEVRDVELEVHPQLMSYLLLLETVPAFLRRSSMLMMSISCCENLFLPIYVVV